MNKVTIKPLSVNEAYKPTFNRKTNSFYISKTAKYKRYVKDVLPQLNHIGSPPKVMMAVYEFGFSSVASDVDNCVKPFQDCLQKKYKFNDKDIHAFVASKKIVKKGDEYIKWKLVDISAYKDFCDACDWE